jgi:hypothetical protein
MIRTDREDVYQLKMTDHYTSASKYIMHLFQNKKELIDYLLAIIIIFAIAIVKREKLFQHP